MGKTTGVTHAWLSPRTFYSLPLLLRIPIILFFSILLRHLNYLVDFPLNCGHPGTSVEIRASAPPAQIHLRWLNLSLSHSGLLQLYLGDVREAAEAVKQTEAIKRLQCGSFADSELMRLGT